MQLSDRLHSTPQPLFAQGQLLVSHGQHSFFCAR